MKSVFFTIALSFYAGEGFARSPLYLDVQGRELQFRSPQVIYDLRTSKGEELVIGEHVVSKESLVGTVDNNVLSLSWDAGLISTGEISILNAQGKELWRQKVSTPGSWIAKDLKGPDAPNWQDGEKFRFCLRSDFPRGYVNLCTAWYGTEIRDEVVKIGYTRSSASPRIIFQGDVAKRLKAVRIVKPGEPVSFFATLSSDVTYEFMSETSEPIIRDLVLLEGGEKFRIVGELPQPLNLKTTRPLRPQSHRLVELLGFEDTMARQEDLWQADIPVNGAYLIFPGKSGGHFGYAVVVSDPPKPEDRQYAFEKTLLGTYADHDKIVLQDSQGNERVWQFEAPEKFSYNRVTLLDPENESTHRSYLDVYRGGPGEASVRLTGVAGTGQQLVAFTEGHVSWWFNDLFGWQSSVWSKQRWGVSAKYFTSLSTVPAKNSSGDTQEITVSAVDVDFRYRFTPGLWEKDETVGLISSFESVDFGGDVVPKLGAGVFWARSMPRVFDDLLNKISFLNYPKWVDMEFIKYFSSLNSEVSLGDDYVLNFHGKLMWTPRFFGEAGFGIKSYNHVNAKTRTGAAMGTLYGTLGVGINF